MRLILLQLALAQALHLIHNIQYTHASALSLSSIINKSCNYDEDGNHYVEVSILQIDLKRLAGASSNSLRLWENGPHCRHRSCCNGERWMWRFNGSQCGSQHLVDGNYETIMNMLSIERKNSTVRDLKFDMAMIACTFANEGSKSKQNVDDITIPPLQWSMYRTDGYEPFPKQSAAVADTANINVGNWSEGTHLQIVVRTEENALLEKLYNKDIHLAVYSCSLNLTGKGNDSQCNETMPLIRKGCPVHEATFFGIADAHHVKGVDVLINLMGVVLPLVDADVKSVFLTCTASLCRDHGVEKYKQVPLCPGYVYNNCYRKMSDTNPSLSDSYESELLKFQLPSLTPTTVIPTSTVPTSTGTSTPATETTQGHTSDTDMVLSSRVVAVVCILCIVCGGSLVAVSWMIHAHCRHRRAANQSNDETVEQESQMTVTRCDVLSLDSGIPGSAIHSPTKRVSESLFAS